MNGGPSQSARVLKAAAESLRPFRMVAAPNMAAFDRPGFVEMDEHRASLPPERRAELERDWSE